jgi:glutamine amidotransferase
MDVVILDYGAGNIFSVSTALKRLGVTPILSSDADVVLKADKLIIPGVGQASFAMNNILSKGLDEAILNFKNPLLGICLGMQVLCEFSEEGETPCLGVFDNRVVKFNNAHQREFKVPQMGWNQIFSLKGPLFKGVPDGSYVYFVHSYFATINENTKSITEYLHPFSSTLAKDNFFATQFHPEKSSGVGERILKNFLDL